MPDPDEDARDDARVERRRLLHLERRAYDLQDDLDVLIEHLRRLGIDPGGLPDAARELGRIGVILDQRAGKVGQR